MQPSRVSEASDDGKVECGVLENESSSEPSPHFAELPDLATRFRSSVDFWAPVEQLPLAHGRVYTHSLRP